MLGLRAKRKTARNKKPGCLAIWCLEGAKTMTHGWSEQKLLLESRMDPWFEFQISPIRKFLLLSTSRSTCVGDIYTYFLCTEPKNLQLLCFSYSFSSRPQSMLRTYGEACDAQRESVSVFRLQLKGSHKVTYTHTKHIHGYISTQKKEIKPKT